MHCWVIKMVTRTEIRELIEEYDRISCAAGISDVVRWMKKAHRALREVYEHGIQETL